VTSAPATTDSASHAAPDLDVVGIGNALIDVLAHESDEFVTAQGVVKGSMTLIDGERADALYRAMAAGTEVSGGSAANTMIGVASLGGTAAYIGKVRDDQLGDIFAHDIRALGVEFDVPRTTSGDPTGRCMIFVTPDGQRTLNTYLGASTSLDPGDVDPVLIGRARAVYLEGYLWDPPLAKEAMRKAARCCGPEQLVTLTLSDSLCVDRHRESFLDLIGADVDVLFANEAEIGMLFRLDDLDGIIERTREMVDVTAITRSGAGSLIVTADEVIPVAAAPVPHVLDTTGAGDLYAAGFLYGLTHDHDLATCGALGSLAAAEVIGHMGPRPEVSLAQLAEPLLAGGGRVG
jgi:sugar/nucleoside kinase (ribokinase family)